MQANTPVVVTQDGHPRHGQAGVTMSPQPWRTADVIEREADEAEAEQRQLDSQAAEIDAQIATLKATAESLRDKAKHHGKSAEEKRQAAKKAGDDLRVDVRFDLDGEVEAVDVASVRALA